MPRFFKTAVSPAEGMTVVNEMLSRAVTGAAVTDFVAGMAPRGRQTAVIGEEMPVAEDASLFERALGLGGRDPAWKFSSRAEHGLRSLGSSSRRTGGRSRRRG